ncbi:hypothetical protein LUZ63_023754, partial [Rhynchospora breviuscula]
IGPAECFRCWRSFRSSIHLTVPPEIPSAPTVLQLGSFHRLSRVEPWDLTADLKSHLQTLYAQSFRINACILCITAAAGTELADAYSSDTVIASSPRKEVYDPWAFFLHAALLRQAFAHCGKFLTAASRRSLGRVLSPSVADHPLGPTTDHRLGKLLPHQLANQTRAPPRADSSFCSSAYGVLARYSPVRHWKHHFPSDLHVLSMPPAFILSQDRTLHEIPSSITYSFLLRRQS